MDTDELLTVLRSDIQGVNQRIDDLGSDLGERIDQVERRFDSVDRRFDSVDRRLDGMDRRFEQVDAKIENLSAQVLTVSVETGKRIDGVREAILTGSQLRLQGLALVVALLATTAVVGSFALQLGALL